MAQKQPIDDEWEIIDDDDEWEIIDEDNPFLTEKPQSGISRFIDKATTPLTDFPSGQAEKVANVIDDPSTRPEKGRHPLAAFGAGAIEGVGDILSNLTAPADLAATASGFGAFGAAARGLPKVANTLRRITQAASAPIAYHGGETILDPETSLGEKAFGLAELAGGAAGMHFPKSALTASKSAISDATPPKSIPESIPDLPLKPETQPAIGEIVNVGGREMVITGFDARGKPRLEIPKDPNFNRGIGDPELAGSESYKPAIEEPIISPETEDVVSKLFPGMERGNAKWQPDLGLPKETSSFSDRARRAFDDETGAIGRDLGPPRRTGDDIDESEFSKFSEFMRNRKNQSIDDLPDIERGVGERFPAEESVNLTAREPIDLDAAAGDLTAAYATPVGKGVSPAVAARIRQNARVEDAFDWPDFHEDGRPERMFNVAEGPEIGSTLSESTLRQRGTPIPERAGNEFAQDIIPPESIMAPPDSIQPRDLSPESRFRRFTDDESLEAERLMGELGTEIAPPITPEPKPSLFQRARKAADEFIADESGEIRFSKERPVPKLPPERIPQTETAKPSESKLRKLPAQEDLDPNIPIVERKAPDYPEPSKTQEVWNLARGTMSVDLPFLTSAAFRQASPLAWTKGWFDAWGKAARSFGDENAYKAIMQEIMNSENFKPRYKPKYNTKGEIVEYKEMPSIAEEAGVKMTDVSHLSTREERIMSTLAEKLPFGWGKYNRASNRAYTGFLNSLRKTKFDEMMEQANFAGVENDMVIAKQVADFINDATGRSSLKMKLGTKELNIETSASSLANVLWSPRLLASRLRMLNPQTYMNLDPMVRTERLKGLMRTAGTWWGFAGLASMAGAEVGLDPSNSNFGKIKIGDTRIDPGAGFQQLLVFGARMLPENDIMGGKFTSSATGKVSQFGEGYKPRTRLSTAEEFAASKLHPMARLAWDLMNASSSRPVHLTDRIVQMALPLVTQDIIEIMKEDPELALIMAPLSSAGIGSNTYGNTSKFGDPVFTDSIEEFVGAEPKSLRGTVSRW